MDAFKIVVVVAIIVSVATLGTIIFISENAIDNSKIPDVTRGLVVSKGVVLDSHPANYTVNLQDNQALYILNNPSLYELIQENQSYIFDCRIDFNNKMTLIENATLIPMPTPAP
jgi:hypothetical protein